MTQQNTFFFNDIFLDNYQIPDSRNSFNIDDLFQNSVAGSLTIEHPTDELHQEPIMEIETPKQYLEGNQPTKKKAWSTKTKNVCYNICQKTIKVIKKGVYQEMVDRLCQEFEYDPEQFEIEISKRKQQFTGPKALKNFVDNTTPLSSIFSKFMKWFLEEKYLRYAINNGEMNDIQSYIIYKNQVMLPILL